MESVQKHLLLFEYSFYFNIKRTIKLDNESGEGIKICYSETEGYLLKNFQIFKIFIKLNISKKYFCNKIYLGNNTGGEYLAFFFMSINIKKAPESLLSFNVKWQKNFLTCFFFSFLVCYLTYLMSASFFFSFYLTKVFPAISIFVFFYIFFK